MLTYEVQRESRVSEKFTHGLVGEVKPVRKSTTRRGFTLIERVPRQGIAYSPVERTGHTNYPFRVCSLTPTLRGEAG